MTAGQLVVLAAPVFLLLIAAEFAWGWKKGRNTYRLNDTINSLSLGILSHTVSVFSRVLRVAIYGALYTTVALVPIEQARAFWSTWYGALLALVFFDFCYYWLHRTGHECALFWAAHVVHHQSQEFNLSTALRHSSSGVLVGIFYLPMAMAGVPPLVFGAATFVHVSWQFAIHTRHVGRLGWIDRWFSTPSNHRVHHSVNEGYWQRNYGGILIVWDRLFGTYSAEGEPCIYGTRRPLNSWDPLWLNVEVYWSLLKDSWRAARRRDKLRVWFKSPGWRPADVAARDPAPSLDRVLERYHPAVSRRVEWFGAIQFALLLAGAAVFLWHADRMPLSSATAWVAALAAGLWSVAALMQGRITIAELLLIEAAALAAATGAADMVFAHRVFAPLTLLIGLVMVLGAGPAVEDGRRNAFLLAGLWFWLLGDTLLMLMFPGFVVSALLALLLAQLFCLAVYRQRLPWFPSRGALLAALAAGAALYGLALGAMLPALRIPVAGYALVVALAVAQAIGRASVLGDRPSIAVAAGAVLFMASHAIFVLSSASPRPMAQFLALAAYHAAQVLIVAGMLRPPQPAPVRDPRSAGKQVLRA